MIDDREGISGDLNQTQSGIRYGLLITDGECQELKMRDVPNRIIHASHREWTFSNPKRPALGCRSQRPEHWIRAEIDVVAVAALCGQLMRQDGTPMRSNREIDGDAQERCALLGAHHRGGQLS